MFVSLSRPSHLPGMSQQCSGGVSCLAQGLVFTCTLSDLFLDGEPRRSNQLSLVSSFQCPLFITEIERFPPTVANWHGGEEEKRDRMDVSKYEEK